MRLPPRGVPYRRYLVRPCGTAPWRPKRGARGGRTPHSGERGKWRSMSVDAGLQHLINGWAGASHLLDGLMVALATDGVFVYPLALLGVYFAPHPDRRRRRRLGIYAAASALIALGINVLIGMLWYRPRPFVADPAGVHLLVRHGVDSSFPSDHATLAFAVSAGLWAIGPAWRWPLLILSALIAFARVFVGAHWPTDVIAGAILGSAVARVVLGLGPRLDPLLDRLLDALGPLGRDTPPARPRP